MPRNLSQAIAFLIGFWMAIWLLQPLGARADERLPTLERELHSAVNSVRAERHLVSLTRHASLDEVARAHSQDMATRRYLSHDNPDGENPVDRLQRGTTPEFSLAGENVGLTTRAVPNREILNGWMHSPVHRDNLLAPAWNATGIGIAAADDGRLYYTQVYVHLIVAPD